jgi:hypothetical protein
LFNRPVFVLKRTNRNKTLVIGPGQRIPQRSSKRGALDLNDVASLGLKTFQTTQYACTEEMDMYVTGPAKHRIFEMMMFQVRD